MALRLQELSAVPLKALLGVNVTSNLRQRLVAYNGSFKLRITRYRVGKFIILSLKVFMQNSSKFIYYGLPEE